MAPVLAVEEAGVPGENHRQWVFDLMSALIVTYMIFENNQNIFWSDS
jgi:hypothetical protein